MNRSANVPKRVILGEFTRPPRNRGGRLVNGAGQFSRRSAWCVNPVRNAVYGQQGDGVRSLFRNRISGSDRNRHGSFRATEANPLELSRSPVDRPRWVNRWVAIGGFPLGHGAIAAPPLRRVDEPSSTRSWTLSRGVQVQGTDDQAPAQC